MNPLKLIIDQSLDHEDVEITIKCRLIDAELEKLIAQIRLYGFSITGKKDGATYPLRPEDIYYFESIDDKTFAYCEKDVYECSLRLYELEQQFARADFVRISKSCILNIMKLSSSSIVFFLTTFLRSQNAFSAASTVIGTLSGFLTGIYVPDGQPAGSGAMGHQGISRIARRHAHSQRNAGAAAGDLLRRSAGRNGGGVHAAHGRGVSIRRLHGGELAKHRHFARDYSFVFRLVPAEFVAEKQIAQARGHKP